jgi:NAD(P)-dependent dehydrogenase (short-subunit alcohol dehydrogenase family)
MPVTIRKGFIAKPPRASLQKPKLHAELVYAVPLSESGDSLAQEKGFDPHDAYGLSKLAVMMITREMAERVQPPPTVNCLDPGTVNTKMLIAGARGCPWRRGVLPVCQSLGTRGPACFDVYGAVVAEMLLAAGNPSQLPSRRPEHATHCSMVSGEDQGG